MSASVTLKTEHAQAILQFKTYKEASAAGDQLADIYSKEPGNFDITVADGKVVCWAIGVKR